MLSAATIMMMSAMQVSMSVNPRSRPAAFAVPVRCSVRVSCAKTLLTSRRLMCHLHVEHRRGAAREVEVDGKSAFRLRGRGDGEGLRAAGRGSESFRGRRDVQTRMGRLP